MLRKKLQQFGLELKKERETRNIQLEDISQHTKISLTFLKSIESGNFNFLPAPYPHYFLKSYLQYLGGNAERFLKIYEDLLLNKKNSTVLNYSVQQESFHEHPTLWRQVIDELKKLKTHQSQLLISGSIIIVIMVIMLFFNKDQKGTSIDIHTKNTNSAKDSQLASFSSLLPNKKKLTLSLVAQERTWVQIAIDDSSAHEYIFETGDNNVWQADEQFFIRIGNGAGIKLYLNGNDLGKLGKRMEVINFILNKDGIHRNKL